jgi:hypothetical protein
VEELGAGRQREWGERRRTIDSKWFRKRRDEFNISALAFYIHVVWWFDFIVHGAIRTVKGTRCGVNSRASDVRNLAEYICVA